MSAWKGDAVTASAIKARARRDRLRASGRCVRCNRAVDQQNINLRTGYPYQNCQTCRRWHRDKAAAYYRRERES